MHPVMQHANDCDSVAGNSEVDRVPLDVPAPVALAIVVTRGSRLWRFCQRLEGRGQHIRISVRLLRAPILTSVLPDALQIALRGGGEPKLSHASVEVYA